MMAQKYVEIKDLIPIISEKLANDGEVIFTPFGISMKPLFKNGKDIVILKKLDRKLKKNDLPLYQRDDGKYILHRVIKVYDNTFDARGDNQIIKERNISLDSVIAIVIRYKKGKKQHSINDFSYKLYCFAWDLIFPLRWFIRKTKNFVKKIFKKKKSVD